MGRTRARVAVALAAGGVALSACAPSRDVGPAQTAAPRSTAAPAHSTTTDPPATTLPPSTVPPTSVPATTTTTVPAAEPVGHYPLAGDTLAIVDTSRPTVSGGTTVAASRTLTTPVWRPAVAGRWPLIVFSHGFQVGPEPYETMLQAWASAGYVVAAPEFPLTDEAVAGIHLDENDIQNQPADVRFVVDTLVSPSTPLSADIDPSRVLYAGHSDGAETALAASLAPAPAGEPAPRAVLCMSVSPLVGVTSTANPPLLLTQGDRDPINPQALGMQTYAAAAGPKYYLDILGGDHLSPLEAGSRWLATIESTTLAFFHLYAYGGGPATLLAAGDHPGLTTISASG